jgi:hypothetical protein
MAADKKRVSEVRALLEDAGLQIQSVERTGKGHFKFRVSVPGSTDERVIVSSNSPSDHRTKKNLEALARRTYRSLLGGGE